MALTHDVPSGPSENRPDEPLPDSGRDRRGGLTRRRFLGAAGGGVVAIAAGALAIDRLTASSGGPGPGLPGFAAVPGQGVHTFHSRPDLRPPKLEALGGAGQPGYLLIGPGSEKKLTQQGPMMVDNRGQPVWFRPLSAGQWASNVRATLYQGEPVIAWWEGVIESTGYGRGEAVIVNASYQEVARIKAAGGRSIDLHEFQLTPQGTAIFTCYPQRVAADLTAIGGPRSAHVLESIMQEVEISSGKLLWEWRSLDHVPITETQKPVTTPQDFDYLHINSIDLLPDGNLVVSGRHTWTLYTLERTTGTVLSRLGGKHSDYTLSHDAAFSWQHDARVHPDGVITLFDNGTDGPQTTQPQSRALVLSVDATHRTVGTRHVFAHPQPVSASSMGSVQLLPSGQFLVGWGISPNLSQLTPTGRVLQEMRLPNDLYTYRVYRHDWKGTPATAPALVVHHNRHHPQAEHIKTKLNATHIAYASWNGDTRTHRWELLGGPSPSQLAPITHARHTGFETTIRFAASPAYAAVLAVGIDGTVLGRSPAVKL